jgi:hypothetical protein
MCIKLLHVSVPLGPSSGSIHLCLAKGKVSLKYQLKYFVKIAVVQWQ